MVEGDSARRARHKPVGAKLFSGGTSEPMPHFIGGEIFGEEFDVPRVALMRSELPVLELNQVPDSEVG
ncbi:MAG: hypothetical protein JWR34_7436 [Mycobacterium sp.]|nr:hypothetical protein [Mycobacterium sp.]